MLYLRGFLAACCSHLLLLGFTHSWMLHQSWGGVIGKVLCGEALPRGLPPPSPILYYQPFFNRQHNLSWYLPWYLHVIKDKSSGVENGHHHRVTAFWLGHAQKSKFWVFGRESDLRLKAFRFLDFLFSPFLFLLFFLLQWLTFYWACLRLKKFPRKRHRDGQFLPWSSQV